MCFIASVVDTRMAARAAGQTEVLPHYTFPARQIDAERVMSRAVIMCLAAAITPFGERDAAPDRARSLKPRPGAGKGVGDTG